MVNKIDKTLYNSYHMLITMTMNETHYLYRVHSYINYSL